ncbi:MAG TPA: PP2C family protein-serine/threonine phosphatase [Elusimicrobiota bacterium]|nr:PP2C family protein-serine/threonine phosphatase [Elusimicrobiota bacterium]
MPVITVSSAQGPRSAQEDRVIAATIRAAGRAGGHLIALFDGHRGAEVAQRASETAVGLFQDALNRRSDDPAGAFGDLFAALVEGSRRRLAGSTASLFFFRDGGGPAWAASLGDSPIATVDGGGHFVFAAGHNVRYNLRERSAATARGAIYSDGYIFDGRDPQTGLQMSRSLGDGDLDAILDRRPEIQVVTLGPRSAGFVGSDGLLGPMEDHQATLTRLLQRVQAGAEADDLVSDALERSTGDNVSAAVWRLSATSRTNPTAHW